MTTDTGLPGEAAEPIEPARTAEDPSSQAPPAAVPTFGQALAAYDSATAGTATLAGTAFGSEAIEAETARRVQETARRAGRRRNAVRWLAAVTVTLALGGGTAFALTIPRRTDMPGLGTAPDGRYSFPALTLPPLPAGQPAPGASENSASQNSASLNAGLEYSPAGQHLADIRKLLLPRPVGATSQAVKAAANGWLTDPSGLFTASDGEQILTQFGLRHTAVAAWKTGDGATTSIYLLQFSDGTAASGARIALSDGNLTPQDNPALSVALAGTPSDATALDLNVLSSNVNGDYTAVKGGGKNTRYGACTSGDTIAIVIQSGPADLPFAPFQQVMTLQAEMLQ